MKSKPHPLTYCSGCGRPLFTWEAAANRACGRCIWISQFKSPALGFDDRAEGEGE